MPLTAQNLPPHISSDFRVPEEFLSRKDATLSHLYQWNARENPDYPLFLYHDPVRGKIQYITYSAANEAINRAARYLIHSVGRESIAPTGLPVVGILANTGASLRPSLEACELALIRSMDHRYHHLLLHRGRCASSGMLRVPHLNAQCTHCRR